MTRQETINKVAEKTGFMKKDVTAIFTVLDEIVVDGLKTDGVVKPITGVTLKANLVAAHDARNPKTGETVKVPAKKKVTGKFSESFKAAVNE